MHRHFTAAKQALASPFEPAPQRTSPAKKSMPLKAGEAKLGLLELFPASCGKKPKKQASAQALAREPALEAAPLLAAALRLKGPFLAQATRRAPRRHLLVP